MKARLKRRSIGKKKGGNKRKSLRGEHIFLPGEKKKHLVVARKRGGTGLRKRGGLGRGKRNHVKRTAPENLILLRKGRGRSPRGQRRGEKGFSCGPFLQKKHREGRRTASDQ